MTSNLGFKIFEETKAFSDQTALQAFVNKEHQKISYKNLFLQSTIAAKDLIESGVQPGDRVILLAESRRLEWVIALFAIWQAQATAVLVDPSLSPSDFKDLINRSDARCILTSASLFSSLDNDKKIPILNIEDGLKPFENTAGKVGVEIPRTPDSDLSTACIIFTSGTTGHPQGVILTHENIYFVANQSVKIADLKSSDQVLGILPLNHVFGLVNVLLSSLLAGATVTFAEKIRSAEILEALKNAKITTLPATPRVLELFYHQILQKIHKKGKIADFLFSTIKSACGFIRLMGLGNPGLLLFKKIHKEFGGALEKVISGAAPLSHEIFRTFEQIGWTVIEGYGLTETAGIVAGNTWKHRVPGTVGYPVDGIKLAILHPNAAGEGEICISGPNIMKGYFRNPIATDEVLNQGWLHTGDLGYLDKEGDLIISGRIKELIVSSGGKKAMPADIERRYQGIPGIQELAVVGIKSSSHLGDEIHAAIVLDNFFTEQQIINSISERSSEVPSHLRIRHNHFVDQIPKTSTLKVKKGVLKDQLQKLPDQQNQDCKIQVSSDSTTQQVLEMIGSYISQKARKLTITTSSSLQFDLGIDSLDRLEIVAKIEKAFSIKISELTMQSIDKVGDIVSIINKNKMSQLEKNLNNENITLPRIKRISDRIFYSLFKKISNCLWKTQVQGVENIPKNGPFILCSNHQSYLDAYWIFAQLPSNIRQKTCCVARKELGENWATALLAYPVSIIPADRDGDAAPAIKMMISALSQGRPVLIFPEGNRSRGGEMREFRRGAAHLALKAGVPIIPVRIEGAFNIFPRHCLFPRLLDWRKGGRYFLSLKFGRPIYASPFLPLNKNSEVHLMEQVKLAIQLLNE